MRTVVNSQEVCHLWAHGAQDHARNGTRSVWFNYGVLYSYGSHFPIGLRLKTKDGGAFFLLTEDRYSVTTSKHQSWAMRAVPGENHYVPCLSEGSSSDTVNLENVAHIVKRRAREALDEGLRMRKSFRRYAKAQDARRWYTSIEMAAAATGQKKKIGRILGSIQSDYEEVMNGYAEYCTKQQAARERRDAAYNVRQELRRKQRDEEAKRYEGEALASLPNWRNGGTLSRGFALPFTALRYLPESDEVESTQHVRFPAEHARKLYPIWKALADAGRAYKRNGHTIHLGPYALDEITEAGDIKAGCHYIPRHEVETIAQTLKLCEVKS